MVERCRKKTHILVPIVTNLGAGPSNMHKQNTLEHSEEQTESQQIDSNQDGEDQTDEDEGQDSVKTTPNPNRPDKSKMPKVEEQSKPHARKKAKASKDKNIDDTPRLTSEDLDVALSKSIEVITKKWSEFAAV